jgi:hypothetical protein
MLTRSSTSSLSSLQRSALPLPLTKMWEASQLDGTARRQKAHCDTAEVWGVAVRMAGARDTRVSHAGTAPDLMMPSMSRIPLPPPRSAPMSHPRKPILSVVHETGLLRPWVTQLCAPPLPRRARGLQATRPGSATPPKNASAAGAHHPHITISTSAAALLPRPFCICICR